MKGATIWFTGLSGSGKTTIANLLTKKLRGKNIPVVVLDGDIVRKMISLDLGYSKEERDKHITRVVHVCELITKNDVLNIACFLSPTRAIRDYARKKIRNFIEVYIKCPIEVCEKRDVKHHYSKVREGKIKEFVGISIPYEEPKNPDIVCETDKNDAETCTNKILKYVEKIMG